MVIAGVALAGSSGTQDLGRRLSGPFCINKDDGSDLSVAKNQPCKAGYIRKYGARVHGPQGPAGSTGPAGPEGRHRCRRREGRCRREGRQGRQAGAPGQTLVASGEQGAPPAPTGRTARTPSA